MNHAAALLMLLIVSAMLPTTIMAQTSQPVWQKTPQGDIILRPFDGAPYPHASRKDGFKGSAKTYPRDPHYVDSTIGIVIPAGYVAGDSVDYIVHFHGHNNHVSKVIEQYKLPQQLTDAKVNAILLVPQGPKDASDSGDGKLELDPGAFARLIEEVTAYLKAEGKIHTNKLGRIVLSAHSGGYKVTAAILDHGGMKENITDVLLLDSTYGSLQWYADWCAASPEHRLISLFTEHLADENKELMGMLDKAKVPYRKLDEATLTNAQLTPRGPAFMPTKLAHDLIPTQYFGKLVATSALATPATKNPTAKAPPAK